MTAENLLLNAIQTPSGIPINNDIITAVKTIEIVIIISSHKPNVPIRKINTAKTTPASAVLKYHPNKNITIIKTHHGRATKNPSIPLIVLEKDRKSTRLNSSHVAISYAVFCLKKKK